MTATGKAKAKFSSRNLNAVYKAPLAKAADQTGGFLSSNRMLVLKSSSSVRSSLLTTKSPTAAAPAPINTPSLRKENKGQDVHVNLVPTGRSGWGNSHDSNGENHNEQSKKEALDATSSSASVGGQQPPFESSSNVWGAGGISRHINRSMAPSSSRRGLQPRSARPMIQPGDNFAGANSGRWGDDAVEQDILRSDMMQKEREFPQLKDAVAAVDPHDSYQQNRHPADHHRYQRGDQYPRYDSPSDEMSGPGRSSRYSNEFERHECDDLKDDRFAHQVGPMSHNPWSQHPPHSYGYYRSNCGGHSGDYASHYHPSDARYDGFVRAEHPSYRRYSQYNGGYSGRSQHGHQRGWYDERNNVGHSFGLRQEGWHRHYDQRDSNSTADCRYRKLSAESDSSQILLNQSNNRGPLSQSSKPVQGDGATLGGSDSQIPVTHQFSTPAAKWSIPAPAVYSDSRREVADETADGSKSNVSTSNAPSAASFVAAKKVNSLLRPSFAESRSATQASTSISAVTQVGPSSHVRILKRDGPKMLFDPKTGSMINAEEKILKLRTQKPVSVSFSLTTSSDPDHSTEAKRRSHTARAQDQPAVKVDAVKEKPPKVKTEKAVKGNENVMENTKKDKPVKEDSKAQPSRRKTTSTVPKSSTSSPSCEEETRNRKGPKRIFVKSSTKKYVLAYRPVGKQTKNEANTDVVVASAPMKKFNELFSSGEAVEKVSSAIVTLTSSLKPEGVKCAMETKRELHRNSQHPLRKIEKTKTLATSRTFTKNGRQLRRNTRENTSTNNIESRENEVSKSPNDTASTTAAYASHEDGERVRHNIVRTTFDLDVLKNLPEGSGVVVLHDAQEGIEFLPEDSSNRFEIVKSRRAILLEKKQLKEAAALESVAHTKRRGMKKHLTSNGIVVTATIRSAKRTTLVVGVRRMSTQPDSKQKLPAEPQSVPRGRKYQEKCTVVSTDGNTLERTPARSFPTIQALPKTTSAPKVKCGGINSVSSKTVRRKAAESDTISASRSAKHENDSTDHIEAPSAILSTKRSSQNGFGAKKEKTKKKDTPEAAKESRQKSRRTSKRSPVPIQKSHSEEITDSARLEKVESKLEPPSENGKKEALLLRDNPSTRKVSNVIEPKPSFARARKSTSSMSASSAPVKVRYVVKQVQAVDTVKELKSSKSQRPGDDSAQVVSSKKTNLVETTAHEKKNAALTVEAKTKSKISKQRDAPSTASRSVAASTETEQRRKMQNDGRSSESIQKDVGTPSAHEKAAISGGKRVRPRRSHTQVPKPSPSSAKPHSLPVQSAAAGAAKKRVDKANASNQGSPAATKAFKQIYVVKKASSPAAPVLTLSAA